MDEEKRSNQNYEIIESCTIGSTELVIGHNPNSPNPYVSVVVTILHAADTHRWESGYFCTLIFELISIHVLVCCMLYRILSVLYVTVHTPLSREVFWHEYAKIPRHTSQNSIAAGNLE